MRQLTDDQRVELGALEKHLNNTYGGSGQTSVNDIKYAIMFHDLEALRLYKKLLPVEGCNTTRLNIVMNFYRRQGVKEFASFLTAEIVITLVLVALAVSEATDFAHGHFESPEHDPILLESLNYVDRADEIVALIKERNITDVELFRTIMDSGSTHHTAVKGGIL